MSHSYLTKKFKEYEGITIQQYIISEKLKAAANMLKYSDASISEIAEYLSFASQSHMGQYFKKAYQMTPKEYRGEVQDCGVFVTNNFFRNKGGNRLCSIFY